jgi:integrase
VKKSLSFSLIKRGSVYYIQWYEKVGTELKQRRKSLKTKNIKIAESKRKEIEQTQNNPNHMNRISELMVEYILSLKSRMRKQNLGKKKSVLRQIFGENCDELTYKSDADRNRYGKCEANILKATFIQEISPRLLNSYFTKIVREYGDNANDNSQIGPTTANRFREEIRAFIYWAMTVIGVSMPNGKNPVCAIKKFEEKDLPPTFLTIAQIAWQLFVIRRNLKLFTMVAVMIFAGLRREELLWLRLDDIDLNNRTILIRNKTIGGVFWKPKNKKDRTVPISSRLTRILCRYKANNKVKGWLFPSPEGGRWDPDNFSDHLKQENIRGKLEWSCLDFRHTFGSHLAKKNLSLFKISELMGNSPEICRKHYAYLMTDQMHAEVEF